MNLETIHYHSRHLEKLKAKSIHAHEMPKEINGTAMTVMAGKEPIAIIGGFFFTPTVLHAWGLISEHVHKYPIAFHKTVCDIISFYEEKKFVKRIQVEVRLDYKPGQRWLEAMGFSREGIMKSFGPLGEDHVLYGRVL